MHTVDEALADDTFAVALRYKNLTPPQADVVIGAAKSHLGEKYNLAGVLDTGSDSGLGAAVKMTLLPITGGLSQGAFSVLPFLGHKRVYCSELVSDSFMKAGLPLSVPQHSTPGDMVIAWAWNTLVYVGHLKP
jgi:hypothetical protein